MGIYDRPYYRQESYNDGWQARFPQSAVVRLIVINVIAYLVCSAKQDNGLLQLTSETLLRPWEWWRFVTYGFAHRLESIGHLFGNMLALFLFGRDIEGVYGRRNFTWFYLATVALGGLVWAIHVSVTGMEGTLVGASGAVVAIVILFALHFPRRIILFMMFIPMPAWVLGVIIVGFDFLGLVTGRAGPEGTSVAYDVHLAGAAIGFLFHYLQGNRGGLAGSGISWWHRLRRYWTRPRLRVRRPDGPEAERRPSSLEQEADRLLEKVYREGESSLTSHERQILEDYSRRMKQKHRR